MNEARPRFQRVLEHALGAEGAGRLCTLLQETGAIVAGGSVLQAFQDATLGDADIKQQDFDIYVPVRSAEAFLHAFVRDPAHAILHPEPAEENPIVERSYKSALYCKSFLQKNGIKKVYNFVLGRNSRVRRAPVEFDVMIVRNRRTPLQVVNNFDLTFCQIWFDGRDIYASHPEDIKHKSGTLQGEYVDLFLSGNKFLHRRIAKYGGRGYKVALDAQPHGKDIVPFVRTFLEPCKRPEDDVLLQHWSSRVLLSWFLKIRDTMRSHTNRLPPNIRHENILFVPLKTKRNRQFTKDQDMFGGFDGLSEVPKEDDGYDSEDYMDNVALYDMAYKRFLDERSPTDLVQIPAVPTNEIKELLFFREANKLYAVAMWPNIYNYECRTLGELLENREMYAEQYARPGYEQPNNFDRALLYARELKSRCVRKGTSFLTQEDDVEVFDLHEHPLEAGISADDLEQYLQYHITDIDKSVVPCYYKPNPADHSDPINCKHPLTLANIWYIVSKEFYKKYSAEPPQKLGLDQFISHYDQTLGNVKSEDPYYGFEYHHSVCPFCLQFDSRDTGCSYMFHENSKHEPEWHMPYCDSRLQIQELMDRYRPVSGLDEEDTFLSFCAECGRPCVNHAHISSKAPYTKIEAPMRIGADGLQHLDYATCTGGGRAELFARILAIRKVYREGGFRDTMEERKAAALAADDAPNNPELMAQGAAIFAQEEHARRWTNAPVPTEKMYNDPAYRPAPSNASDIEGASMNMTNNNNNNDSQRGGYTHKTTVKKSKRAQPKSRKRSTRHV